MSSSILLSAAATGPTTSDWKFQYTSIVPALRVVLISVEEIFFSPACLKRSDIKPDAAQRNIPGAPGTGGGISTFLLITLTIAVNQKFFSATFHTDTAILPPGFNTRTISFAAIIISGKNMKPKRQLI